MAIAKMNRRPWKKRQKSKDEKPVFIFETQHILTGAAKRSLVESLKRQVKDGVVLLDNNTTLVYAGDFKSIGVVN